MEKVTVEQVEALIPKLGERYWRLRDCSICNVDLGYVFLDGLIGYKSDCACSSPQGLQPRSKNDIVETMNMQTPKIRERMWAEFTAAMK